MNEIHNLDFRDIIGNLDKQKTLIITDPPYNVGWKYDTYNDKISKKDYRELFEHFVGFRFVVIHYIEDIIEHIIPIMGNPTKIVPWVYNSNMRKQHRQIAFFNFQPNFNNGFQPYKNPNDKRVQKLIQNGSKGAKLYDWWQINLVKNVSKEKQNYSNQIPEKVIQNILDISANENDIIFDPFMGSGTTPFVAKKNKYKYVATDISKNAYDITIKRLKNYEVSK